jgi:superfamily I DNA and/or RNA helicase
MRANRPDGPRSYRRIFSRSRTLRISSNCAPIFPTGNRIGTVDKFQGQEAPVVIYSMTASSREEAAHGMEFLFSRHRLNVATSRARCVCILVGNPELFDLECRTPEQMRMANAFCAYLERARVVSDQ